MATGQLNLRTVKLGDNADTSKNFLIQVPAVADGSLSIQTESGVPVFSRSAAGVITFGAGQTWQDVKASRAFGTTYTNSTGQSIKVSIIINPAAFGTAVLNAAGIAISYVQVNASAAVCLYGEVPAGGNYSATATTGTINTWSELR